MRSSVKASHGPSIFPSLSSPTSPSSSLFYLWFQTYIYVYLILSPLPPSYPGRLLRGFHLHSCFLYDAGGGCLLLLLNYVTLTLKILHLSIVIALNSRDLCRVYIMQPGPFLLFAWVSQHTVLHVCVPKESFSSLVELDGQGGSGGCAVSVGKVSSSRKPPSE